MIDNNTVNYKILSKIKVEIAKVMISKYTEGKVTQADLTKFAKVVNRQQ